MRNVAQPVIGAPYRVFELPGALDKRCAAPEAAPGSDGMRIAQVAPLYESVPPAGYGGTERVVS